MFFGLVPNNLQFVWAKSAPERGGLSMLAKESLLRIIGHGDGDAVKQLLDGTYFAAARSLLGSCFGRIELVILPFIDHLLD